MSVDKVLLVVGVIEGRKFPKKPGHKLLIEAKFDGETLSTDPVDHNENPDFTTELAWESDKKSLHQHRLQRTPIKLQCYAIDANERRKEPVGYCILDLRSAQMNAPSQKPVWFALLNSKYHGIKPELRVVISLEDERQAASPEVAKEQLADETEKKLLPILDEDEGHYLIGDKSKATDLFCLSVTIAAAKNLTRVIPSSRELRQQDGFYFFYKLLGNDVKSEPLLDTINPNFPPERASVRILSNISTLQRFIAQNSSIEFYFCSGENSLASTTVSLLPILTDDIANNIPSKIEGFFPLTSPDVSPPSQSVTQLSALLGISVVLRTDNKDGAMVKPVEASPLVVKSTFDLPEHPFSPPKKVDFKARSTPGTAEDVIDGTSYKKPAEKAAKKTNRPLRFDEGLPVESPGLEAEDGRSKQQSKARKDGIEAKPNIESNHYCFSIDLRSVKSIDTERPINCFCRYTYPFFGSSSPVLTSPAVEVRKNTEVLLPRSFCAFDFATNSQLIEQTLARIPLIVEVWHRDQNRKDALLGICQIDLASVFSAEKINVQGDNYRQIDSQLVNILTPDSFRRKVGLLHAVLGLENLGPIKSQPITADVGTTRSLVSASPTENTFSEISDHQESSQPSLPRRQQQQQQQQQQMYREEEQPRDLPEYKAAIELELWKEQQEENFKTLLLEKEAKLMQTLAEEWKKRDKEREIIFQRKVDEYSKLEEKLKASILDLERREKQVSTTEAEVHRLKADLLREHEQKLSFLREASVRMKEDCDHRIELEKLKLQETKEQCQRYKEQLQTAEKRYKDKENEIMSFREQLVNRPETKMQAELNLALLEKAEQERKLDQVTKSKIHYKQQWGKALRELAKMKQNEQMAAKMRLKQQERELEHMRLRYLAAEEKEMIKSEQKDLVSVKEELQRLRESHLATQPQQQPANDQRVSNVITDSENNRDAEHTKDPFVENRIAKLIEERDTLLRTGVYSNDDKIISELDKQIREAISEKDR